MSAHKTWKGLGTVALLAVVGCGRAEQAPDALGVEGQAVQNGPDFVVTAVTGPAGAKPGEYITTQVTVCNQGTQPESTDVEVLMSADKVIQSPAASPSNDRLVGYASVPLLFPGQCTTVSVGGWADAPFNSPGPEGAFFLGAVVDPSNSRPETSETNNAKAGNRVGLGHKPDFIVKAVTSPTGAKPGDFFTPQVTVCNQGTQPDSTEVQVLMSMDNVFQTPWGTSGSPEDRPVGAPVSVPTLFPGQCTTLAVNGWADAPFNSPSPEGVFFLGAVVDPHNARPELFEDNNAKAGNRVGLGHKPDFVVTAVTGPTGAMPGDAFTAQVTVCNHGTQPDSSDVQVLMSTDATFQATGSSPPDDRPVGFASVPTLFPTQCTTVPVSSRADAPYGSTGPEGIFYLGAMVDPHNARTELFEDNNAKAGHRVGLGFKPDFVVTAVTGPTSAMPSEHITTQVTVCNQGTQDASTDVQVLLSVDNTFQAPGASPPPSDDRLVGSVSVPMLSRGQCTTVPVSGWADAPYGSTGPEGIFYLGAVVDPHNARTELFEDNNTKAGNRVGLGFKPDFVVRSVTGPTSAMPGQYITTQVTVCNQGTQTASTDVQVLLSTDTTIQTGWYTPPPNDDRLVGSAPVPSLLPGQCTTVPVNGWADAPYGSQSPEGAFYLGAVVDPHLSQSELFEDNNSRAGNRLGLGNKPDFVITSVTGPTSATPGQHITTQVTVCNQGNQDAGSTDVQVLLSTDTTIQMGWYTPPPNDDRFVGSAPVPPLAAGQCTTVPVTGWADAPYGSQSPEGAFYLGAVVDSSSSRTEFFEDNNSKAGPLMGLGHKADFVVTAVTGPTSVQDGQGLTAQVTVCNQGTVPDATEVEVYLSLDTTIRPPVPPHGPGEDMMVGSAYTPSLAAGQCATVPVTGSAYPPYSGSGPQTAFYLGASADPRNARQELIEDNNTKAGSRIGVGHKADFVVTAVTGPTSVQDGQSLTAQVTVCNQGTVSDATEVEVYLSLDTTIRPPAPPHAPGEDMVVGSASTPPLAAGQCATVPVTGSAYPPYSGSGSQTAFYLGASADPRNARQELIEDNNTRAGRRIGVGHKADFVVTAVTGPASVQDGQSLTAQVTVCNQGTVSDATEVEVYLSLDTTIQPPSPSSPHYDGIVGSAYTPVLTPGQCTTVPVNGTAYPPYSSSGPQTAFYLGAVADPRNSREELIEDNNARAGNRIGVGHKADFVIQSVTAPASVQVGSSFTATVTVCNRGQAADGVDLELYFSADTTFHSPWQSQQPSDSYLGQVSGLSLAAGACTTVPAMVPARVSMPASYYLIAVADPGNFKQELIEDNNTKATASPLSVTP